MSFKDFFKSKKTLKNEKLIADAKEIVDAEKEKKRKLAEEPYINLKGIVQQSDGQIKIDLDWDDNFISHLKKNGYTGPNEEALIQKYLLELTAAVADDMSGDSNYE